MTYVFSNIYRHKSDGDFVAALRKFRFESPRFLFLNMCVPLLHGKEFFRGGENYAYLNTESHNAAPRGLMNVLDNMDVFRKAFMLRYEIDFSDMRLSEHNAGTDVWLAQQREKDPRYLIPKKRDEGKPFTAGFFAYFFARAYFGDEVCLVNFYGMKDASAAKPSCHDLEFEDEFLSANANKVFI